MNRLPGPSARLKFTLSYAALVMVAGIVLLTIVWLFLLRYVPDGPGMQDQSFLSGPSRDDLVRAFVPPAAWAVVFLLAFGLVGGWVLAGRMLAPLARLTTATRKVAEGSLSHRVELEGRRDEFRELADSLDAMLARIEAQVGEQQRFAANASHELRTPLAITQTLLDVARRDPERDNGELVERLRLVNTRAIELTEALLVLSRADQRTFARDYVDLSLVAEQAAETLLPLAEARRVTVETAGEPATTVGSYTLLLQLATNLVHNAIVHNTPHAGLVQVTVTAGAGFSELAVENTGEKLTRQLVATFTEPFQRGSERIRGDHSGVGLGLAIVQSIARAHDGILTVSPRPEGGLRVSVRLPTAPRRDG